MQSFIHKSCRASCVALLALMCCSSARGQEEDDVPEPQIVDLMCKDGMQLKATYYPGTRGRDSVPIIMLHMNKGNRNDFHELALFLQGNAQTKDGEPLGGHAVLVPDLRGHGDSTSFAGSPRKLDAANLRKVDYALMVTQDVEACKRFLMEKNNDEELNIDKLTIVGAELGAVVAVNWAALDWSWPVLTTGKQGQDVKALVLLSPAWSVKGFGVNTALVSPAIQQRLAVYTIVGSRSKDAVNLHKAVSSKRDKDREQDVFLAKVDTSLEGTKMLAAPNLQLPNRIAQFIKMRVADQTMPWTERNSPISSK